jgi:hypothetical protein
LGRNHGPRYGLTYVKYFGSQASGTGFIAKQRDFNPFAAFGSSPEDQDHTTDPLMRELGRHLRAHYERLLSLPVPDRVADAIERLANCPEANQPKH